MHRQWVAAPAGVVECTVTLDRCCSHAVAAAHAAAHGDIMQITAVHYVAGHSSAVLKSWALPPSQQQV